MSKMPRSEFAASCIIAIALLITLASIGSQFWRGEPAIEIEQAKPQQALFEIDASDATVAELCLLPGIGEKLSRKIVETREDQNWDPASDLQQVKGIGAKKVAAMEKYLKN